MSLDPETDSERQAHNQRQGESFDRLVHYFSGPIADDIQARTARIVAEPALPPGSAVLDVGTGTGMLLPSILDTRPSAVVACDLSTEMLRQARERFGGRVRFIQADVIDLPGDAGPFDAAFCNACFANFYDPAQALQAIHDRLRPGGAVVISHPLGFAFVEHLREQSPESKLKSLPDRSTAAGLLSACGFTLDRLIDEPELYILIGRRR